MVATKIVVFGAILLAWTCYGVCDTSFSEAVQQSQRAAVQVHPELGVQGSTLNRLFVRFYATHQADDPAYFKNDQWPLQLAEECVQELPQELARVEQEELRVRAKVAEIRAMLGARELAFKCRPIPLPDRTPFDFNQKSREEYLKGYKDGYCAALMWGRYMGPKGSYGGPDRPESKGQGDGSTAALCYLQGVNLYDKSGRIVEPLLEPKPVYGPGY